MSKHYIVRMRISVRDDGTGGTDATLWELRRSEEYDQPQEYRVDMDPQLGEELSEAAMRYIERKREDLEVDKLWRRIEKLADSGRANTNGLEVRAIAKAVLELKKEQEK